MSSQSNLKHSQNFIRRTTLVRELLGFTDIDYSDVIVEIGAGRGVITQELLKKAGSVIAIEQDPRFAESLYSLNSLGNLNLVIGDFFEWRLPEDEYKVFSNIPFNTLETKFS